MRQIAPQSNHISEKFLGACPQTPLESAAYAASRREVPGGRGASPPKELPSKIFWIRPCHFWSKGQSYSNECLHQSCVRWHQALMHVLARVDGTFIYEGGHTFFFSVHVPVRSTVHECSFMKVIRPVTRGVRWVRTNPPLSRECNLPEGFPLSCGELAAKYIVSARARAVYAV